MNLMRTLTILICITCFCSCNKNNKATVTDIANQTDSDVAELLNPDENFSEKKSRKAKKKDSLETSFVAFSDLNRDGKNDTAFLIFNNKQNQTTIYFSGLPGQIIEKNNSKIRLKDIGDLNGDGKNEIMMTLLADQSCWDEVKLYSYLDTWVEKYNGLAYQCIEDNSYQFSKVNSNTVKLITYGVNKDSIDQEIGDTLENVIPNARMEHLISW